MGEITEFFFIQTPDMGRDIFFYEEWDRQFLQKWGITKWDWINEGEKGYFEIIIYFLNQEFQNKFIQEFFPG